MTEDIICVDGEINTVSKEIEGFLESMISSISSYNSCLKQVQMVGIQDEMIRAKLGNLSTLLSSYKDSMSEILENFQKDKAGFLKDFEKNDFFSFPGDLIQEIERLLRTFS